MTIKWKSRTLWTNVLAMASAYAVPAMGLLQIDPTTRKAVVAVAGINIALRAVTKDPLVVLQDAATEP